MKKVLLITALLLVFGLGNAYAVPITFNIDELYDWGRLYSYSSPNYTTTNSNPAYYGGGTDTPIGTVVPENTPGIGDGEEDSWGVASVASITSNPPGTTYFQRSVAQELTFMFYGFDDDFLSMPIAGNTIIGSVGGHVSVYLDTTPDFDGSLGTGARTGLASYTGATDGLLVLDLVPVVNTSGFTLQSTFDLVNLTGSGSMYLSTTGAGAWDYLFDTNTQLFGSDLSMSFTALNNGIPPSTGDWVVRGDARGEGNYVPEPASMAVFGAGLLGLVGTLRRKRVC